MPKQICSNCRFQLDTTYIFRTKSKNVEAKLKRHIRLRSAGKLSNVLDEEEEIDEYADSLTFVLDFKKQEESNHVKELQCLITTMSHNEQILQKELDEIKRMHENKSAELVAVTENLNKIERIEEHGREYYVEVLEEEESKVNSDEPEVEEMDTDDDKVEAIPEDEIVLDTRYECDSEEYSAIEKAVRV